LNELQEEYLRPKEMRVSWIKAGEGLSDASDANVTSADESEERSIELKREGRGHKRKSKEEKKLRRTKNARTAASAQRVLGHESLVEDDSVLAVKQKRKKLKEEILRQVEAADSMEETTSSEEDNDDDFSAHSQNTQSNMPKKKRKDKKKRNDITQSEEKKKRGKIETNPRPREEIDPNSIEQKRFRKCENIFLKDMDDLQIAIETKDVEKCLLCLGNIDGNVKKIVPSFVEQSKIGILIKNARYVFEHICDEVKPKAKALTNSLKEEYNAKEKFQIKPKKRLSLWPEKVQGIVDLSTKVPKSDPMVEVKTPIIVDLKLDPKHQASAANISAKKSSLSSDSAQKPVHDNEKPSKKIFSLAKIFEPKTETETQPNTFPKRLSSLALEISSDYPKWLKDETMDDGVNESPIRELSMEFLKETMVAFKSEKVDPKSIIYALEKAIFEYSEGDDIKYWDKVHDIVSAILGRKQFGTIVKRIEDGVYRTPRSIVLIPGKYLYQSFENKEMTV
jgi:hypothetical protein